MLGAFGTTTCSAGVPSICSVTVTYTAVPNSWAADSFTYRTFDEENCRSPNFHADRQLVHLKGA